jgi:histidinol-phosphate aminotransferase
MQQTKLHLNEIPFAPSTHVIKEIQALSAASNRYPEWDGISLRSALGQHYGFDPSWIAVAGTGSIGLIQQAMIAAGTGEIAYCWPTFEAFDIAAKALRMPIKHVELKDYACDMDALADAISPRTSMVIVCTPNAPTGGVVGQKAFDDFMERVPDRVLVVLDEAYGEFVDDPDAVDGFEATKRYPNLLLTRTFSKAYGLAGIRVGYGIAQPELAEKVRGAGLPFPVPAPFQAAAIGALQDQDKLHENIRKINSERARLAAELRKEGAEVVEGFGNYVWLPLEHAAEKVVQLLKQEGVLAKAVIGHGVRITVGTPEDTAAAIGAWQRADIAREVAGA